MDTRRRAAVLGVGVTVATAALAVWLVRMSVARWPGGGEVPLDGALGFLATSAAAGVATWTGVVLAAATVPLLGQVRSAGTGGQRAGGQRVAGVGDRTGRRTSGPAARVTAALLAAAALSTGSTAALAGPDVRASQLQHHAPAEADGTGRVSATIRTGPPEAAPPPGGPEVPRPGWTHTPDPTPGAGSTTTRATSQVDLVTTAGTRTPVGRRGAEAHVVVHRGDTLWSIAARHLGGHASDGEVAEAWPRWYVANRDVIGDDPDHILPGQVLRVPTEAGR